MHSTQSDEHLGVEEGQLQSVSPSAKEAQRMEATRTGKYQCEVCHTTFEYHSSEQQVTCPKCHNEDADSLTPVYVAEDPQVSEMMTPDQFAAGD